MNSYCVWAGSRMSKGELGLNKEKRRHFNRLNIKFEVSDLLKGIKAYMHFIDLYLYFVKFTK